MINSLQVCFGCTEVVCLIRMKNSIRTSQRTHMLLLQRRIGLCCLVNDIGSGFADGSRTIYDHKPMYTRGGKG